MPRHGVVYGTIVALIVLPLAAACDTADGHPTPSPSAPASSASAAPTASPTTPSPSPKLSQDKMMLHAAQTQFKKYYKGYLVEGKKPAKGPSKALLAMTDPDGPERIVLKKSFANARSAGSYIASADVRITVGPEMAAKGSQHRELKFRACIDGRKARVTDGEQSRSLSWELLDVSMRAKPGASKGSLATHRSAWRVYRANQVDSGKSCGF